MPFRILCLDGGGIRGVIEAVILAEVEKIVKVPLNRYFDLIAGTSTGSILASAIALGKKSEDIIQLYRQRGKIIFPYTSIFSPQRLSLMLKYGLSAPKYSDKGLIEALQTELGNVKLGDIKSPKLLITAYDTFDRQFIVFKNWQINKPWIDTPLWEVCVCSSSAPTFFPAHLLTTESKTYSLIDGGIGANNPSACAVAEALRLDHPIRDISVLSIGTGDANQAIPYTKVRSWGLVQWIWQGRLIEVIMDASADVNDYISRQVMSPPEMENEAAPRYFRLQPKIMKDAIDDASDVNIDRLITLTEVYLRDNKDLLVSFLEHINS
ncbi:CBASS cGAMP-activated phospholipase [Aerosakkonemataceae cyanobacterium BLCC-F154]|uniref:CBASS cGAMP-activated phospholipase n=1 Tax=Floridaenema fluviatile BLCC-F154 TaxID=3153640 RepID=A0ABV4YGL5_9CYAN